jgi:hypothetical protein
LEITGQITGCGVSGNQIRGTGIVVITFYQTAVWWITGFIVLDDTVTAFRVAIIVIIGVTLLGAATIVVRTLILAGINLALSLEACFTGRTICMGQADFVLVADTVSQGDLEQDSQARKKHYAF